MKNKNNYIIINDFDEIKTKSGTIAYYSWNLGTNSTGTSDNIPVIILHGAKEGPVILIYGSIHGDEPSSSWAVLNLLNEINPNDLAGKIILIPALNINAYKSRTTATPIDGVELYRAFPGTEKGSYTKQLAYRIENNLFSKIDYLIDIHSGTSKVFCTEFTSYPVGLNASKESEELALAGGSPIMFPARRSFRV